MRTFTLERGVDESGVSGTGIVVEGVVFSDGRVALQWLSDPRSFVLWDDFDQFWQIHVASHPTNNSIVRWGNGEILYQNGQIQLAADLSGA